MQEPLRRRLSLEGLAPRPVSGSLLRAVLGASLVTIALGGAAQAASSGSGSHDAQAVYRKVLSGEQAVVQALTRRDAKALVNASSSLGPLIDAALARRKAGQDTDRCDLAAHSLAFLAINAAEALMHEGEARRLLIGDAQAAATDFGKDMRACEAGIGRQAGSHTSAEKALRAL